MTQPDAAIVAERLVTDYRAMGVTDEADLETIRSVALDATRDVLLAEPASADSPFPVEAVAARVAERLAEDARVLAIMSRVDNARSRSVTSTGPGDFTDSLQGREGGNIPPILFPPAVGLTGDSGWLSDVQGEAPRDGCAAMIAGMRAEGIIPLFCFSWTLGGVAPTFTPPAKLTDLAIAGPESYRYDPLVINVSSDQETRATVELVSGHGDGTRVVATREVTIPEGENNPVQVLAPGEAARIMEAGGSIRVRVRVTPEGGEPITIPQEIGLLSPPGRVSGPTFRPPDF